MTLSGKRVVVGVGGGIAAYKAVVLVRELMRRGATVRVCMTESGARFVGPITFTGVTGAPAVLDLWDPSHAGEVHVDLGAWADAVVVAPATQNLLARAAHGMADDAVLATVSCARGPVLFAPAMHTRMWTLPATRRNVATLVGDGATIIGPEVGPLASGEVGEGRMSEPEVIADAVELALLGAAPTPVPDLDGRRVLVTAGPTVEDLDPVRFLGNRSTGRMGYALAERAHARGADVILVSGPVALTPPAGVTTVPVRSAREMRDAVMSRFDDVDVIVMAAAVADYRPAAEAGEKIKKTDGPMTVELVRNPDILAELGARRERDASGPLLCGFAVESSDLVARAQKKLASKKCDLVVANLASVGFGGDENEVVLVARGGDTPLPRAAKRAIADEILDRLRDLDAASTARAR